MAIIFNIIACMLPLVGAAEIEVAGRMMGRVVRDAVQCPQCGAHYNLIVPVDAPVPQVDRVTQQLRAALPRTCGQHPVIIQEQ